MADSRPWRIARAAAILWGIAVAAVTAVLLLQQFGPWPDTRLPADETARQLRAQLGVDWTFSCTREEGDETIPGDIDYYCHPSRDEEVGYFVDADRTSIEIVSVTG
jgi:hypothetical protein